MELIGHLKPKAHRILSEPIEQRIEYLKANHWIGYSRAAYIMRRMDQILMYPRGATEAEHLLIQGRPGNGKSTLLRRFRSQHKMRMSPNIGETTLPVIFVEVPERPALGNIYSIILDAMFQPHGERMRLIEMRKMAYDMLSRYHVRMIVMDEFHNLAQAGKATDHLLSAIRGISNQLKISFVAAGISTASNLLSHDLQMARRFVPLTLRAWVNDLEYRSLLSSFNELLPLRQDSMLGNNQQVDDCIHQLAGESIGEIARLLRAASVRAMEIGVQNPEKEMISLELLEGLGWTGERDLNAPDTEY